MKNKDYQRVVSLVQDRASLGSTFTCIDIEDDWLAYCGDLTPKTIKQIQKALSAASGKQIVKVDFAKNPRRSGGNIFVWSGVLVGDDGSFCPSCRQHMPVKKTKTNRDGSDLTQWT